MSGQHPVRTYMRNDARQHLRHECLMRGRRVSERPTRSESARARFEVVVVIDESQR